MRRRAVFAVAVAIAAFAPYEAISPGAAGETRDQLVEGRIELPDALTTYPNQCTPQTLRGASVLGEVGSTYEFTVGAPTRGMPFSLTVTDGVQANVDVWFFTRDADTAVFATTAPGGEHGVVPRGATRAAVCLAEGARAAFRYTAGPSTKAPTVAAEAAAARSAALRLLGRAHTPQYLRRMVFQGDLAVASSRRGITLYRLLPRAPHLEEISHLRCPGGPNSNDISIWGRYVFQSVPDEYPYFPINPAGEYNDHQSATCNNTDGSLNQGGIRVIDIADPERPRQIKFFALPCGSMNHTLVPHGGRLYIYAPVPCDDDVRVPSTSARALNYQIKVLRFDVHNPASSRIVSTPRIDAPGGQFGCHDVTVLPSRALAACPQFFNEVGHTSLLDIADPLNPRVIARLPSPVESTWMSHAAFSWDGRYLVLSDSDRAKYIPGRVATGCHGPDQARSGAVSIYDIRVPSKPVRLSQFRLPRPGGSPHLPCAPWEISIVPTTDPARRVAVIGWLSGGLTVVDFSDPARPRETAFWQPAGGGQVTGSYFYNGRIYAAEDWSGPGVRVFEAPGLPARATWRYATRMNPQTQLLEFR